MRIRHQQVIFLARVIVNRAMAELPPSWLSDGGASRQRYAKSLRNIWKRYSNTNQVILVIKMTSTFRKPAIDHIKMFVSNSHMVRQTPWGMIRTPPYRPYPTC